MDPAKLKVVELRAELTKRGLDTKGTKPFLVERLRAALDEEKTGSGGTTPAETKPPKDSGESEDEGSGTNKPVPRTPSRASRRSSREPATPGRTPTRSSSRSSRQSPAKTVVLPETVAEEPKLEPIKESTEEKVAASPKRDEEASGEAPPAKKPKVESPVVVKKAEIALTPVKEQAQKSPAKTPETTVPAKKTEASPAKPTEASPAKTTVTSPAKGAEVSPTKTTVTSPAKVTESPPAKAAVSSPVKITESSPAKAAVSSPVKVAESSPAKAAVSSPVKVAESSPAKAAVSSPVKVAESSPMKPTTPATPKQQKIEGSPEKKTESPVTQNIAGTPKQDTNSPNALTTATPKSQPGSVTSSPVGQKSPQKKETPTAPVKSSPQKTASLQQDESLVKQVIEQSPVKQSQNESLQETETPMEVDEQKTEAQSEKSPQKSPVKSPIKSPMKTLPETLTKSPLKSPVKSPVKSNLESPVKSPQKSTTSPIKSQASESCSMESPSKTGELSELQNVQEAEQYVDDTPQDIEQCNIEQATDGKAQGSPAKSVQSPTKSSPQKNTCQTTQDHSQSRQDSLSQDENEDVEVKNANDSVEPMETDEQKNDFIESDSPKKSNKRRRSPTPVEEPSVLPMEAGPEDEPEFDDKAVLLSWYDSDLHLVINKDNFLSASPMKGDGFSYMWAGVRASYGFLKNKVYYEVKIIDLLDVNNQDDPNQHVLRTGWSIGNSSLQLGQDKHSYCYDSLGKELSNNEFKEFGKPFTKDDIVGCYADFSDEKNIKLSYTLNGEKLEPDLIILKEELDNKALYPHILSKNCSFGVNFGQEESWNKETLEGYDNVGKVTSDDRVAGPHRTEKREDCEVILLCGLPGSGKTTWAKHHIEENRSKSYNMLGTNSLIERMKVTDAPIKETFQGRWENILEKATRALRHLVDIAPSRRRNYILDQAANVYASSQKKKMTSFYGFHRKAIVILPTNDEFLERIKKKDAGDGETFRENTMLEMKASFVAPTVGDYFDAVDWVELDEDEGKKLIETYNSEGKSAGFGHSPQTVKKSRFDKSDYKDNRDNRNQDRRSNYQDRNRGDWRGGRWRGNDRRQSGGHQRPFQPGGIWRGRGSPALQRNNSDRREWNDRRSGNQDRRRNRNAGGYQGSAWAAGAWPEQNWGGQTGVWAQGQHSGGGWKGYGHNYQTTSWNGAYNNQTQQYHPKYHWNQTTTDQTSSNQAVTAQIADTTPASSNNYPTNFDYAAWSSYAQSYGYAAQDNSADNSKNSGKQ